MIDKQSYPEAWFLLIQELDDLREHVGNLVNQMSSEGRIDEEDYAIQIQHAYEHLNRAWNTRNCATWDIEKQFDEMSRFPGPIDPVG